MAGFKLTERAARATAEFVGRQQRKTPVSPRERGRGSPPAGTRYMGYLTTPLTAPEDGFTDPTTATVQVLKPDPEDASEPWDLIDDDEVGTVTVVNRDSSLSADADAFVKIEFLNGEWSFYWVGC